MLQKALFLFNKKKSFYTFLVVLCFRCFITGNIHKNVRRNITHFNIKFRFSGDLFLAVEFRRMKMVVLKLICLNRDELTGTFDG